MQEGESQRERYLLLIHQIPPKPNYLRAKIGRRLQRLGAVAIKNSVYALPASEEAREELGWVLGEIAQGGGDGSIVAGTFVAGLGKEELRDLFRAARDADYDQVLAEARALHRGLGRKARLPEAECGALRSRLARLRKQVAETAALDFFGAKGREPVEGLLRSLAERLLQHQPEALPAKARPAPRPRGATWVTRTGLHVDRMASGWLIRRFIDGGARFRFVDAKSHRHRQGDLRFDMFDGEYTHQGDLCTFEVLLARFGLEEPALARLGEIVHDIDLKDDKYGRPEKTGIETLVNGIATAHPRDEVRLARASAAFDDLYELFKRKR